MIDEIGSPLICDFGKSRQLNSEADDMTKTIEGTPAFLPPECCQFEEYE